MAGVFSVAWDYNERFEVVRLLGSGGMGIVYEAIDRQRQGRVALKTLLDSTAIGIAQFKSEFRTLSDLYHPNLVSLYELFDDSGRWFFTMEYVPGLDFIQYVLPNSARRRITCVDETQPAGTTGEVTAEVPSLHESTGDRDDERLPDALRQVVEGLIALHDGGKLHCDIKPSNVLITPEGRVVLLDFGLVQSLSPDGYNAPPPWIAGTLAYMSPEQAMGQPLSAASDWYAVGVMLYQALTGRLPFTGTRDQVLQMKLQGPASPPSRSGSNTIDGLASLTQDLLCPTAQHRPKGGEILRRIPGTAARTVVYPARTVPFVGRANELKIMREARAALERKQPGVLFVSGQPGTGKTALLNHFAQEYRQNPDCPVLSGRCREQESIPFKALDSLVDSLARLLHSLPVEEALCYIPRDADALCRLFPVLRTAPAFAQARGRAASTDDQQRLRQWAFGAFREMISRIGDRYRLSLLIDDVQWGDADSAGLLSELLMPPDPPALLLICAYRVTPGGRGAFLQNFDRPEMLKAVQCWNVELGPLSHSESTELARLALKDLTDSLPEDLAAESRGNVYFLLELAARASEPEVSTAQVTSLEGLLLEKVRRLTGNAQRLLEMVAICGQPVRQECIFRAAGVEQSDLTAVSVLRSWNLVTITGLRGSDLIDSYHDRVRETVLANLETEASRECHLRLARVLQDSSDTDPEMLAVHFEAGGDRQAAGQYYSMAGRKAAAATAFEHAARLLSRALTSIPAESDETQALRIELADALANAGRSAEAARRYKEAAGCASGIAEFELNRKSGYHFAISGHPDEAGLEFRKVLGHAGVYFPNSLGGIVAGLFLARGVISMRTLRFKIRTESEIPPRLLEQLDASQAALAGFGLIDLLRAVYFSSVSLWFALKAGEPNRLIYSLALEASGMAATSARSERKGERLLALCQSLVKRYPSRWSQGISALGDGFMAFATAQWQRADASFTRAETFLAEGCPGVNWELASIQYLRTLSQVNMGRFSEVSRCLPGLLREAEERGDLYLLNSLRGYVVPVLHLAADLPETAEGVVEQVENWLSKDPNWPGKDTNWLSNKARLQHVIAFMSGVLTQLYSGRYQHVWSYTETRWKKLGWAVRICGANAYGYCLFMRIQAAIAAASVSDSPSALLRTAEGSCRALARLHPRFTKAMLLASRAGISSVREQDTAAALFGRAAEEYEKLHMPTMAAGCRLRQGVLTPGRSGTDLIEGAEAMLRDAGVKRPRAFALALVAAAPMQPFESA
jgi:serine/threonine protein kinase/tetratricopeptide (TPR) repeat protein